MSNLINLVQKNDNYYFKSDKISVYPCAYRGADDSGKFFNPASRYTSEQNITSTAVGLAPNGTYISDIIPISTTPATTPTTTLENVNGVELRKVNYVSGLWKFTIGGYNFEAQIDATDLTSLKDMSNGKAILFEINPQELPDDTGLGKVLTSHEEATSTPTNLDQKFDPDLDYCFTGLKVTVITESMAFQPTSTKLFPVLYTTIKGATALVLNQYARLPEITHGPLEGEAEITKLNVLENITLETADSKNLLVENQLVVGTAFKDDDPNDEKKETIVFKVTLNRDPNSGAIGTPAIEFNEVPVTILTDTDTALFVAGGVEIEKSLTVTGSSTTTGMFSAADGNFVVNTDEGTTIKNNLTIGNKMFEVAADSGNTAIAGELHVGPTTPYLSVASGTTTVNTTDFEAKNVAVEATTNSTSSTTGALKVKGGVGVGENLNVGGNLSAKTTTVTGKLTVKDSNDPNSNKFTVEDTKTTIATSTTEIDGDSTTVKGTLGVAGTLTVNPGTTADTLKFEVDATNGDTTVAGELKAAGGVCVNVDEADKFSVDTDGNTTIAGTLEVAQDFNINVNKETNTVAFSVNAEYGNTTIAGTLSVDGKAVSLVDDTIKIEKSGEPEVKSVTINGDTQITKTLTITDTSDTAIDITNGGLSVKGKIAGNGALEVSGAAAVQSLGVKSGATISPVITSSLNLQNIAKATVGRLDIKPNGYLIANPVASIDTSGNLVAKSIQADTLNVPNCDASGKFVGNDAAEPHTTLSLGPGPTLIVGDKEVSTKSFYFNNTEYKLTPAAAKADLLDMIYPVGSIYMTMTNLVYNYSLSLITIDDKEGYAIFDHSNTINPAGGLWVRISQGRVLLGAGDVRVGGEYKSFYRGLEGGYYDSQPWAHVHQYEKANDNTEKTALETNQMPRHNHTATTDEKGLHGHTFQFVGTNGSRLDVKNCNRIRLGSSTDGAAITYESKKLTSGMNNQFWVAEEGNHTHPVTVKFTGGNSSKEIATLGEGHKHTLRRTKTVTTGCRTSDTQTNDVTTTWDGNLPPYLVCYIWQRIA